MRNRTRNLAFIVLLCSMFLALQANVFASMTSTIQDFCEAWEDGPNWDCTECATGLGFPPGWSADGECDFSGIEDENERLEVAGAYMADAWFACDDACGPNEGYPQWVAEWYWWATSESDPCFSVLTDDECWWTWGQAGGQTGTFTTWSCSCQRFNVCVC